MVLIGILGILILVVMFSGCNSNSESGNKYYNSDLISFTYPGEWSISSDGSNSDEVSVSFEGPNLLVGEVYSENLSNTDSVDNYISTYFENYSYNSPKHLNGHTFYEGFNYDENDPYLVYNLGIFVDGNKLYIIRIHGNDEGNKINDAFYKIRDSFKIKK